MDLEIIISQKNNVFVAKTPSFPHCKGIGHSKKEALTKLTDSISRQVARKSKSFLTKLFEAENYSEVILDPSVKSPVEHRIYDASKSLLPFQKNILMKLNKVPELKFYKERKTSEPAPEISDLLQNFKTGTLKTNDLPLRESTISIQEGPIQTHDDGFIFGIPLSLN